MVLDHEICCILGDLNYRIDGMSRDAVQQAVANADFAKLIEHDQLTDQRRRNAGFRLRAFQEAQISFEPTYKYDIGTDDYDTSEKRRIPAWCDRILYRGGDKITAGAYKRHEVKVSDHRPVSGQFDIQIKTIRGEERLKWWREAEKGFEKVKGEVTTAAKLDYLQLMYDLTEEEARRRLQG